MSYRSDLEVLVYGSPGVRKALFGLFLLSLVLDVEMLLPASVFHFGPMQQTSTVVAHLIVETIGAAAIIGATLLWLVMFYLCLHDSDQSLGWKVLWGLVFFFTIWLGAQLFYLFPFQRLEKRFVA
jgi:hypothetical protein